METFRTVLKTITTNIKQENEIDEFKTELMNCAKDGKEMISISFLEEKYPTIYKNGYIWDWCGENDILISGGSDLNGKNHLYTFCWQYNSHSDENREFNEEIQEDEILKKHKVLLKKLAIDSRVVCVMKEDNNFYLRECCDEWFCHTLTKEECIELSELFREIADEI